MTKEYIYQKKWKGRFYKTIEQRKSVAEIIVLSWKSGVTK